MAPFPLESIFGSAINNLVYILIGLGFGAVLEMSGFGDTNKLAAQFYFKELTVLKVMFTAIVVAMVLIFLASGLGLLDFSRVWVNPTFLWPGIVGGLIMGFGFVIGGFCPGTSLVAVATFKVDGMFFLAGVFGGIFIFGETVADIDGFWHASSMGRFMLPEWLGLSTGLVVLAVVAMALFLFWGAEKIEAAAGLTRTARAARGQRMAAAALVLVALGVVAVGQPDLEDRWNQVAASKDSLLTGRAVYLEAAEVAHIMGDDQIRLHLVDLRPEAQYNIFHLARSHQRSPASMERLARDLEGSPANTVVILVDGDERLATQAWKDLVALKVPNAYILEGGIPAWLGHVMPGLELEPGTPLESLFPMALGARSEASEAGHEALEASYVPKLKLSSGPAVKKGGCG